MDETNSYLKQKNLKTWKIKNNFVWPYFQWNPADVKNKPTYAFPSLILTEMDNLGMEIVRGAIKNKKQCKSQGGPEQCRGRQALTRDLVVNSYDNMPYVKHNWGCGSLF